MFLSKKKQRIVWIVLTIVVSISMVSSLILFGY